MLYFKFVSFNMTLTIDKYCIVMHVAHKSWPTEYNVSLYINYNNPVQEEAMPVSPPENSLITTFK